mgnify:CR=1 FL=1
MAKIDGDWFRAKLAAKHLSQRAMAKHLGIDPGALSLMLNGRRRIQLDEADSIAVFLSEPLPDVLRAAGLPLKTDEPSRRAVAGDPLQALKDKRDELLAEVETLNKAIQLMER